MYNQEINIAVGPFSASINTNLPAVINDLSLLYSEHPKLSDDQFFDFKIQIRSPNVLRHFFRPQVNFYSADETPFKPLPLNQASAMFEWGFNWCIANHAHHFLIFHAAVLEKNGVCVIMPAPPGSGKSTLCASLTFHGWRLLSDELTMLSLANGKIYPLARPINLKNNSIDLIKNFAPSAVFTSTMNDTHKGSVALLKPSAESVVRMHEKATATHIIFPQYLENAKLTSEYVSSKSVFLKLIENSFNYHLLGKQGFTSLMSLVKQVNGLNLTYSSLDDGINYFDSLANQ